MKLIKNNKFNLILTVLIIFSLQSWTKADDLNDFQIEGMSIGENLIKHAETIGVSVNEIKSYNLFFYPKSKKYAGISFANKGNFTTFEAVQFTIDPDNYDIVTIGGKLRSPFKNNMKACHAKQKEILNDLKLSFDYKKIEEKDVKPHNNDKTGKSTVKETNVILSSGRINIRCTDWTENIGIPDSLTVSILTDEHSKWLREEAY